MSFHRNRKDHYTENTKTLANTLIVERTFQEEQLNKKKKNKNNLHTS